MRLAFFIFAVGVFLLLAAAASSATLHVSQPVQVTGSSYYERGQAITSDGSDYYVVYGRSASVTGNYGNSNPDVNDYDVYVKKASTVPGLAGAAATAIHTGSDSYLGEMGAAYFGGDVWAFATLDVGASAEVHGWWSNDGGSTWNQVASMATGLSDGAAHHDEIAFGGEIFMVLRRGDDFYTTHSSTPKTGGWSTEVAVGSAGGLCHFFADGGTLYLAVLKSPAPRQNEIWQYVPGTDSWSLVTSVASDGWDPTLFKVGSDYVFAQAPYVSGRQYIVAWSDPALASVFAGSSHMVSEGRYGANVWVDMWPIGYTDLGGTSYLFYTSERDTPAAEGTGNIWYLEVDWDVSENHYTWVQEAINAATSGAGDEILVGAGTYPERLTVNKDDLTITGAGEALVEIDGSSYTTANELISLTGDNLTLSGFTLDGHVPHYTSWPPPKPFYGIYISGPRTVDLHDLTVKRLGKTGINMNGPDPVTMTNVTSVDNGGAGFFALDGHNLTFDSITTANNQWGGVCIATQGVYWPPAATSNVVFTGACSFGEATSSPSGYQGGLYLEDNTGGAGPISWSANPLDGADVTIQLADFTHTLDGDQDDGLPRTRFYATETDALLAAVQTDDPLHVIGPGHFTTNRTVRSIADGSFSVAAGMQIQPAIDAADPGDVITVGDGTYNESLTLPTTFNGGTLTGMSPPVISGGMLLAAGLDGVTLQDLYIKGDHPGHGSNTVIRLLGSVSNLTMDTCVIDGELVSGRHGFSGGQLEQDATIVGCEFKDVLGWALFESRSGSGGGGSPLDHIVFASNDIHNCNGSVVFRGDETSPPASFTPQVDIYGNTWSTIGGNGAETGQHWAAFEVNRAVDVNVYDNTVDGVSLGQWGEGQAAQFWSIVDLDVHDNTFTSNAQGIKFFYIDYVTTGAMLDNIFTSNGEYGIQVDPGAVSGSIDATCNWWGTTDGPNVVPEHPSSNDVVDGDVTYAPWLDSAPPGTCDQYGDDYVAAEPTGDCLSIANPCQVVPVVFTKASAPDARGVSVTFELDGLVLCNGNVGTDILVGDWITGYPNPIIQIIDLGSGVYTFDQSITTGCGNPAGGTLFTVNVKSAGSDGTGTITVTDVIVRDCLNAPLPGIPGPPADITIDTVAPVAVGDLDADPWLTGNDGDGTTKITLTFGAPPDADVVEVYRAGFGNYPEYDDPPGAGSVPAVPATYPPPAPWVLTAVTTTGQADEPYRDFWYYVVYTKDACGNVSDVSNMTGGTLSYHLGDVAPGPGNNQVDGLDVSDLGDGYGTYEGHPNYDNELDVGPTGNWYVSGLPGTDNIINFEDMMMFAINFWMVSREAPAIVAGEASDRPDDPYLTLVTDARRPQVGEELVAHLMLRGNTATVKGLHAVVAHDPGQLRLIGIDAGDLLAEQGGTVLFETLTAAEGQVIDAAVSGRDRVVTGSGEVATLRFQVVKPGADLRLALADLRDVRNRRPAELETMARQEGEAADAGAITPSVLRLLGARPNPFAASTDIVFRLPETTEVRVQVYDVGGRLIRTLTDGALPTGEHVVRWDGRTDAGHAVAAGIYFYEFRAGSVVETHKIFRSR